MTVSRVTGKQLYSQSQEAEMADWRPKDTSSESTEFRLLLCQGMGTGAGGQEVIDDYRRLDVSKGPRGTVKLLCFWSPNPGCCGLNYEAPRNFLINYHFCMFLSYLVGEVLSRREVVSVAPRLQVRFL